jgi:hypothetical protein
MWFQNGEAQDVERLCRMPAVLGAIDVDEEDAVVHSIGTGLRGRPRRTAACRRQNIDGPQRPSLNRPSRKELSKTDSNAAWAASVMCDATFVKSVLGVFEQRLDLLCEIQ